MTAYMVFNHHSLPFDSQEKADEALPDFLKLCLKAQNIGLDTLLVDDSIDKAWFRLELSRQYFWQDWHNKIQSGDDNVAIEQIRAFRSIATHQPFFSTKDITDNADLFEVSLDGDSFFSALRAAAWHETPLASFPTRSPWLDSPLRVTVAELDQASDIREHSLDLMNFFSLEILEQCSNAILEKRNALIRSGRNLFDKKEQLFPGLIFCGKAPQQLRHWSAEFSILEQAREALTVLNRFCGVWGEAAYPEYRHNVLRTLGLSNEVSGESRTVLNSRKLKAEREFWLPTGKKEVFQNHVKLNKGFRLHFFPDHHSKKIFVGYIGPHLRLE